MTQQFNCDVPTCSFMVKADNVEELIQYAQQHAERHHDATLSAKDAEDMLRTI